MEYTLTLEDLIEWLENQDKDIVIKNGFGGEAHSDRSSLQDISFDPKKYTTIGEMLKSAKSALGKKVEGYKGGYFTINGLSKVFIGEWCNFGESITYKKLSEWLLCETQCK